MNSLDIIIITVVCLCIVLAIAYIANKKKPGKCIGCSECNKCGCCPYKKNKK